MGSTAWAHTPNFPKGIIKYKIKYKIILISISNMELREDVVVEFAVASPQGVVP